jgi:hypothetical protein
LTASDFGKMMFTYKQAANTNLGDMVAWKSSISDRTDRGIILKKEFNRKIPFSAHSEDIYALVLEIWYFKPQLGKNLEEMIFVEKRSQFKEFSLISSI